MKQIISIVVKEWEKRKLPEVVERGLKKELMENKRG